MVFEGGGGVGGGEVGAADDEFVDGELDEEGLCEEGEDGEDADGKEEGEGRVADPCVQFDLRDLGGWVRVGGVGGDELDPCDDNSDGSLAGEDALEVDGAEARGEGDGCVLEVRCAGGQRDCRDDEKGEE